MILENELFCLGHEVNLQQGENKLRFQGQTLRLFKNEEGHLDWNRSFVPTPWMLTLISGVLWIFKHDTTPNIPKLDFTEISGRVEYEYEAEFLYVMENLYDLNHVAGTHSRTLFAKAAEIKNFRAKGKTCHFDFKTTTDLEKVKTLPLWRKILRRLIVGNKEIPKEQTDPITLYFPSVLTLESNKETPKKLPDRTYVAIYPMDDRNTKIVVFTQSGLPKWLLATLRKLRPNDGQAVFAEDGNILENIDGTYERKIRLDGDTPVDYARELYAKSNQSETVNV